MENKVAPGGTAHIQIGDKRVDLPILKGTTGPDVVDIRKFYAESDLFTYDPGFTSTASCESQITYIDGDAGILLYRGYPIDQLAEQSSFLEVCYLLLHGELPTATQFADKARGTAMSLVAFAFMVGGAIGTALGGRVIEATSYREFYLIGGVCLVALSAVALVAVPKAVAPREAQGQQEPQEPRGKMPQGEDAAGAAGVSKLSEAEATD